MIWNASKGGRHSAAVEKLREALLLARLTGLGLASQGVGLGEVSLGSGLASVAG